LIEKGARDTPELKRLSDEDFERSRELEAHFRLSMLDVSVAARTTLIAEGFRSPGAIATAPSGSFRANIAPLLGASETDRIYTVATAQDAFLENLSTASRVEARYAINSMTSAGGADLADCECDDCEAATSPLAYLTDLLTYAQGRLRWDIDGRVTLEMLSDLLQQPFGDLPADCASVNEQELQVRLCIESLHRLVRKDLAGDPDVACAPITHSIAFAFAADVDGDRQDELVVGFNLDPFS